MLFWFCREARKQVRRLIEQFPDVDQELLKEKYPDIFVERVINQTNDKHMGNVKSKTFRWNRC